MNFWKPGEEYPDQNEEEDSLSDDKISFSKNEKEPEKKKVLLSENLKTMPFMVRSNAEKERKKEEVIALKELQAQLWSYRKVKAPEGSEVSTHPCSGSMINTIEEEECKRFSFRGFNNNVELIMKERTDFRNMKKGVKKMQKSGDSNVKDTLRKYSTFRDKKRSRD